MPSPAEFIIGGLDPAPPARRFQGLIDEVQIYDTTLGLSDAEFLFAHPSRNLAQREVITFSPPPGPVFSPITVSISTTLAAVHTS